ncbi:MAG: folate family ECF transporter S component [Alkaliphilus sp.]
MNTSQTVIKSSLFNHSKLSTRKLVLAAIFVAMNIILTRVGSIMLFGGAIRLGFGRVPIVLSSILLGPLAGGLTGIVSDLIGFMLNPMGAFHPGFTLSAAVTGIIPGLVVVFASKNKFSLLNISIANILVYLVVSLGLNTLWLTQLLGRAFFVLLPWRIVAHGIVTVISIFIIFTLSKYFKHIKV